MLAIISVIFICIGLVAGKDICYNHVDLGCFTDTVPFGGTVPRPFTLLPNTPEKIDVQFTLFNKDNLSGGTGVIISSDEESIRKYFNPSLKTKFIIPGFNNKGTKEWILELRSTILKYDNVNVIIVDWSKGNM